MRISTFLLTFLLLGALPAAAANTWSVTSSNDAGASGTVTDDSIPGFSADFSITRFNVVGFAGAIWDDGANLNVFNTSAGGASSVDLSLSFSNVTGGSISSIISEYGNTTNNNLNSTWTHVFSGSGSAVLTDPDNQMHQANGFTYLSGGFVSNATSELIGPLHTWFVTIPNDSVTLQWASGTFAVNEDMAFRFTVAPPVPSLGPIGILILASLLGLASLFRTNLGVGA